MSSRRREANKQSHFVKWEDALRGIGGLKRLVVGYSGGRDSHVLLHMLSSHPNVKSIHINHQINPKSADWAEHCKQTSEALNIPCQIIPVNIDLQKGESLEAKARDCRYKAILAHLAPDEVLLTAHTQDDQAETLLLQLIRGAGVAGLSAMGASKGFGASMHYRPLLNMRREEIEAYSLEHNLSWIEDDSNQDTRFDRNFIRHEILPKLKSRFPGVLTAMSRSAELCQEAVLLQNEIAAQDFAQIANKNMIRGAAFLQLDPKRQRNVIRYWIGINKMKYPSKVKLADIIKQMNAGRLDSSPCIHWGDVQLRRYQQDWYLRRVSQREWGLDCSTADLD